MARAPHERAKSTAARASARLTPRLRNPARVKRQGHGPDTVVSLVLGATFPGDAVVAQQPRVRATRLDRAPTDGLAVEIRTSPLVVPDPGWPHSVCWRNLCARSSAGNEPKDSRGASLYRWHRHLVAAPRVPKTVCRSSQLASLAGTTEIAGSRFVTHTLLR